mmetsp:Transcript_9320/g.12759  ORF Transcript_9320/g.12759 Transcript_9320/m.12759 type:complete len:83 (+) Transcript_9320:319-567(+)
MVGKAILHWLQQNRGEVMEVEGVRKAGTSLRYTAKDITSQPSATSIFADVVSMKIGTVDADEDDEDVREFLPPEGSVAVRST